MNPIVALLMSLLASPQFSATLSTLVQSIVALILGQRGQSPPTQNEIEAATQEVMAKAQAHADNAGVSFEDAIKHLAEQD